VGSFCIFEIQRPAGSDGLPASRNNSAAGFGRQCFVTRSGYVSAKITYHVAGDNPVKTGDERGKLLKPGDENYGAG
jgi:hypothetical protein